MVEGRDVLLGLHANTHLAQVNGFGARFEATGDKDAGAAVTNFFKMVLQVRGAAAARQRGRQWSRPVAWEGTSVPFCGTDPPPCPWPPCSLQHHSFSTGGSNWYEHWGQEDTLGDALSNASAAAAAATVASPMCTACAGVPPAMPLLQLAAAGRPVGRRLGSPAHPLPQPDAAALTEESCTQYNMLKIARYLFRWTGDAGGCRVLPT